MPAAAYRLFFRAHSLKSLERNILHFVGIKPVRESLVGMVEGSLAAREMWLAKMEALGRAGKCIKDQEPALVMKKLLSCAKTRPDVNNEMPYRMQR